MITFGSNIKINVTDILNQVILYSVSDITEGYILFSRPSFPFLRLGRFLYTRLNWWATDRYDSPVRMYTILASGAYYKFHELYHNNTASECDIDGRSNHDFDRIRTIQEIC